MTRQRSNHVVKKIAKTENRRVNFSNFFLKRSTTRYDGVAGSLVRLKFVPNPQFHPSGHSEQVFHHMEGTLLLDPSQKRLAAIDGRLTSE